MKKTIIFLSIITFLSLTYILYLYLIEGSVLDKPKIFYIEDKNAIYKIVTDDSAGYYFLEGTNSYPDKKNFRIIIGKSPTDLHSLIGQTILIEGEINNTYTNTIPCRRNWDEWCRNQNNGIFLVTVDLNKIEKK